MSAATGMMGILARSSPDFKKRDLPLSRDPRGRHGAVALGSHFRKSDGVMPMTERKARVKAL